MIINILITLTLLLALSQIQAQIDNHEHYYRTGKASRDGIGKYYMGREIFHVTGHLNAGWLERSKRKREERTDLLLQKLSSKTTDYVVDLGAGTGYFIFPMAIQLTTGKVLAVDIEPKMFTLIEQRKLADRVENIETVLPYNPKKSASLLISLMPLTTWCY